MFSITTWLMFEHREEIIKMLEEINPKLKEERHKKGIFFSDEEAI